MGKFFDANPLTHAFEGGASPTLLYITKQNFGGKKRDRPMHSHDNLCELLLVYKGFGSYAVEGQSFPIREGDIILANQDDPHEVLSASDAEIGTYCFAFYGLRFAGLPENYIIPPHSAPVCASGTQFHFLRELCENAYQNLDEGPSGMALAQCLSLSFLLLAKNLKETSSQRDECGEEAEMSARFRHFLDERYTEPITIAEIAAAFGCSESYVSHVFKRFTGYSPMQYVIRRRVGLAQTLLTTTDYTVSHIAALVGYDNPNYFTTIFTKVVGASPLRYKKQYLEAMRGKPGLS